MELTKNLSLYHNSDEEIRTKIKRLQEIEEILAPALKVQFELQDHCENIDDFIVQTVRRTMIAMKSCTKSILENIQNQRDELVQLLLKIDENIENDLEIVHIGNERD